MITQFSASHELWWQIELQPNSIDQPFWQIAQPKPNYPSLSVCVCVCKLFGENLWPLAALIKLDVKEIERKWLWPGFSCLRFHAIVLSSFSLIELHWIRSPIFQMSLVGMLMPMQREIQHISCLPTCSWCRKKEMTTMPCIYMLADFMTPFSSNGLNWIELKVGHQLGWQTDFFSSFFLSHLNFLSLHRPSYAMRSHCYSSLTFLFSCCSKQIPSLFFYLLAQCDRQGCQAWQLWRPVLWESSRRH